MNKAYGKGKRNLWAKIIVSAVLLALLFFAFLYLKDFVNKNKPADYWNPPMPEGLTETVVVWVSDGDTIILKVNEELSEKLEEEKDSEITVRLIGLDAPESVHPDESKNTEEGKRASDFVKEKLQGKKVNVEFDNQIKDKYGRYLAYIWLNGELFNKKILEEGHAELLNIPPNDKYEEIFEEAYEGRQK